jgi:hypothetical protein
LLRVFFIGPAPLGFGAGSPYHLNPWSEIRGPLQSMSPAHDITSSVCARVASIDRGALARDLDADGYAVLAGLLTPRDCKRVRAMYAHDVLFRTRIVMARHGLGWTNTSTFRIRFRLLSGSFAARCMKRSCQSRIDGTRSRGMVRDSPRRTPYSCAAATRQVRSVRHRFFFATSRETTTACTGTSR